MGGDDVIEALSALLAEGIDASVEGGWGIDALLGRQTREHADLDLAISREDCAAAAAAPRGNGWQELGDRAWGPHPAELLRRGTDRRRAADLRRRRAPAPLPPRLLVTAEG